VVVSHLKRFDCLLRPCGGGAIEACVMCLVCDSGMPLALVSRPHLPPGKHVVSAFTWWVLAYFISLLACCHVVVRTCRPHLNTVLLIARLSDNECRLQPPVSRPAVHRAQIKGCSHSRICPSHLRHIIRPITTPASKLRHNRSAMLSRKPYQGRVRGLVVAFDVGTTYSGVSYAILDPGEVPKIQGVTRFVTLVLDHVCACR
jgi:hypothetical protein